MAKQLPLYDEFKPARANGVAVYHSNIHTGGRDDWETPPDLFSLLDAEFGFTLDVCATRANTKCPRYFSPTDNGLGQRWQGVCWMNPPYSQIRQWLAKACDEARRGVLVVCLVPARTGTRWWWDYARRGEVRFLPGRLRFVGSKHSAPFPSAVVIFGPDVKAKTVYWDWRK